MTPEIYELQANFGVLWPVSVPVAMFWCMCTLPICREAGSTWALVFIGIGAAALALETLQGWCFGVMGHRLSTRVRIALLAALLRHRGPFFDRPENVPGALMSALARDAAVVRGAFGDKLGHQITVLSCIIGSYVLAFRERCGGLRCRLCNMRFE